MPSLLDQLAEAVLYEGFLLYPYRPSLKNRQRWTFGGLYPRAFCETQQSVESPRLQVECLIEGDAQSRVSVSLRFLRLIDRVVGRFKQPVLAWPPGHAPDTERVESLTAGDRQWQSWQEAADQKLELEEICLGELLASGRRRSFELTENVGREPVIDDQGQYIGMIERVQLPLTVTLDLRAVQLDKRCFRITFSASNDSGRVGTAHREPATGQCPPDQVAECPPYNRDQAALEACVAAHAVIVVRGGELVSQIDPPAHLSPLVAANENVGVWPVLVGTPPDRSTMLAAPIILYDYPQIAPESPASLFDSTEIDEMLSLRIMTLTEEEKQSMRAVDPRARQLLERVETFSAEQLLHLHGTTRSAKSNGAPLVPGDRVRLAPKKGADVFDLFLDGKTATITSIEEDFDGRRHFAVVLDDDPGRDLGEQLQVGHRFFFQADEIVPLDPSVALSNLVQSFQSDA